MKRTMHINPLKCRLLKQLVKRNKRIYYLQRCIRKILDDDFVENVLAIGTGAVIWRRGLGELNKDKNIVIIKRWNVGFCANLRNVLESLSYADRLNLFAVIWADESGAFIKEDFVSLNNNTFEYYFEQPAGISLESALQSYSVVIGINVVRQYEYNGLPEIEKDYLPSEQYIEALSEVYRRHIRLNEETAQRVRLEKEPIISSGMVLGVHIRGTDFNKNYNNHPVPITIEQTITAIEGALKEHSYDKIFLATDEQKAIGQLEKVFGEKLIYYHDVTRSKSGEGVHINKETNKAQYTYETGYEILRDVITLSECDGLIAGQSQVSIMARVIKASNNQHYSYINILNNGINDNDNRCSI